MDERLLFPEIHLLRQLIGRLQAEFLSGKKEGLLEILNSLDDIFVIVDQSAMIHYANPAAYRYFGNSAIHLVGKTLFELMPFPQAKARWQTIRWTIERYGSYSFIDNGHGMYALNHILPLEEPSSEQAHYLIYTLVSGKPTTELISRTTSSTSVMDEALNIFREMKEEYTADARLERHLRIARGLANAATAVSLAEDLTSALNTLCAQACLVLDAPAAVIRLYNPYQDTLEIAAAYGLSEEYLQKNYTIPYAPLSYLASETAPRVAVADLNQSPPTPADQLPYRYQLTASVIGNILRQNRFLGVMVILIPKVRPPISKEDLLFVQAIAEQASVAIDRFQLMEIQARRTRELENLVHLGLELREVITKKAAMDALLNNLVKDIYVRVGATYLLENGKYLLTSSYGEDQTLPDWLRVPDHPLWQGGKPLIFETFSLSTDALLQGTYDAQSEAAILGLAIPFRGPSMTIGVLLLGFSQPIHLSSNELHKISLLQEIGDAALHRAESIEHLEQLVLERTRELSILYNVTSILNAPTDLRASMDEVLENILSVVKSDFATVHLYDPTKKCLILYQTKSSFSSYSPLELTSLQVEPPWDTVFNQNSNVYIDDFYQLNVGQPQGKEIIPLSYVGLPVRSQGVPLGVLSVFSKREYTFSLNDQVILTAIADQLGLAVERSRLVEQGEEIAKLEERQRLARELHDALTQSLYSMTLLASGYKRSLHQANLEEIHQWMQELNDIAQNALAELRLLLYELRPNALEQDGLQGALKRRLEAVEKRAGIETTFKVRGGYRLPAEDEEHFYRIAQEALNNALQHAHHHCIFLEIESTPNHFSMAIEDDGIGFDFDQAIQQNQHSGLNNMFSRARQIQARLLVDTAPGKGTRLLITKEYNHV